MRDLIEWRFVFFGVAIQDVVVNHVVIVHNGITINKGFFIDGGDLF